MLGEFCYWIVNMSITASVTGLIVMAARKIKAVPHRFSVFLWIIPFVRMWVPFGLNSRYSLMTLISQLTTKTVTIYQPADDIAFSVTNTLMLADSYFPIAYKVNILSKVFEISSLVWIISALALILALTILYSTTKHEIRDAVHLKGNVFLSPKVESPAVYGIIRPRIVLPTSFAAAELKHILQHEKTHIRRLDNLWRLAGFLTAAVHWFNPLSWIFLKAFLSDLELACDEAATAKYSEDERREYALDLLNCVQSKSLFVSAFGGAKVRTRIESILSYKKMTAFSAVGFGLLIIIIIYTLLKNAG